MDESTSQAHRMFVRDEDDLTTHEKAWVEAQATLQVVHQEPNMDSMEDSEKFVMKQIQSGFWQNFDEAIEKSCIDEKIHSQLLELCKCRSLNRRITPNMITMSYKSYMATEHGGLQHGIYGVLLSIGGSSKLAQMGYA